MTVDVIIPALDEEETIGGVLAAIPRLVRRVVVVDNGSRDGTAAVARAQGAEVVSEPRRGYGAACLAGIAFLARSGPESGSGSRSESGSESGSASEAGAEAKAGVGVAPPDVVVFLDGDQADDPADLAALIEPIGRGEADLVIGSRTGAGVDAGALTAQQRAGNAIAVLAIRLLYGHRFTDLGPFRAIRFASLLELGMRDQTYGWTVEMQVKALRKGLRVREVPVSYRRRAGGRSKVSGTLRGTIGAGWKILSTVARHARG